MSSNTKPPGLGGSNWLSRKLQEDVTRVQSGRYAPRMFRFVPLLCIVVAFSVVAVYLIFIGLARLKGYPVRWWLPRNGSLKDADLFDLVRDSATFTALFGGVFAIVYAYRKQKIEEAAGHRADAESLSKRYQDAAAQLGHVAAAVRLAGVYALTRLAEEWPEQRQTCVDVLCAYLRMPWDGGAAPTPSHTDYQVRSTILSSINQHIRDDYTGESWSALRFDFSGAEFVNALIEEGTFSGRVSFDRATFTGFSNNFGSMSFVGDTSFFGAKVAGSLVFSKVKLGGKVTMSLMKQSGKSGYLLFDFVHIDTETPVLLTGLEVENSCAVIFHPQGGERAWVSMTDGVLRADARFSALGYTITPLPTSKESLVFPGVDLGQWTVEANASVRVEGLQADADVHWVPVAVDPSASIVIS